MSGRGRVVLAVVPDLMDRSRLSAAPGVEVVAVTAGGVAAELVSRAETGVDLVVADVSRPGVLDAVSDLSVPVVGFAPHVDDGLFTRAAQAGIEALARSVFFRRWPDVGPAVVRT